MRFDPDPQTLAAALAQYGTPPQQPKQQLAGMGMTRSDPLLGFFGAGGGSMYKGTPTAPTIPDVLDMDPGIYHDVPAKMPQALPSEHNIIHPGDVAPPGYFPELASLWRRRNG